MNIYPLLRPLLFQLEPETAHAVTLTALDWAQRCGLLGLLPQPPARPVEIMGLHFKNPVGLAAGLDKNGDHIDALAALGFGFLEIGTVTPKPQPGNPKPRLFRLPEQQAIINRMGFNNLGIDHLCGQVAESAYRGVLGINIGKNFSTPIAEAANDYVLALRRAYPLASYVTINISSPNTQNLRQLQQADELRDLVGRLKQAQQALQREQHRYVPLVLKIAPDLSAEDVQSIARLLIEYAVDGVIATNTTLARNAIAGHRLAQEAGGLSGEPVKNPSTQIVRWLAAELGGKLPIIAAGGISCAADAQEKLAAGASLIQVYSGLIYRGPGLVKDIVSAWPGQKQQPVTS